MRFRWVPPRSLLRGGEEEEEEEGKGGRGAGLGKDKSAVSPAGDS